jgi:sugar/nucleoside kinase (ribokinase family)
VLVDEMPVRLGGALNTASVATALGADVVLVHPAGDGITDLAVRFYTEFLGIASQRFGARPDPALSLVLHSRRDRSFVTYADYRSLGGCPGLPPATWIHVPGLVEARLLENRLAQARARGSRISVSGSWAPKELEQLRLLDDEPWDLLVLNTDEAYYAAGGSEGGIDEIADAASDIVITDGEAGAFGVIDGAFHSVPAVRADVQDTTGAGDAFCAGFLTARMTGRDPTDALEMAVRVASRQLGLPGGVPSDPRAFEDLRHALLKNGGREA